MPRRRQGPQDDYELLDGISWNFFSPHRRSMLLGEGDPGDHPLVVQLGLAATFSIEYCRPVPDAVCEFALGFDISTHSSTFRGRTIQMTREALREAFLLPAGNPDAALGRWADAPIALIFDESPGGNNPYSTDWLTIAYQSWGGPIRAFNELLRGKRKSTQVTGKQMWWFWAYLSGTVEADRRPDWAALAMEDLSLEVKNLQTYLQRVQGGHLGAFGAGGKSYPCNCATAVTRILLQQGFTLEELSGEARRVHTPGTVTETGRKQTEPQSRTPPATVTSRKRRRVGQSDSSQAPRSSLAPSLGVDSQGGGELGVDTVQQEPQSPPINHGGEPCSPHGDHGGERTDQGAGCEVEIAECLLAAANIENLQSRVREVESELAQANFMAKEALSELRQTHLLERACWNDTEKALISKADAAEAAKAKLVEVNRTLLARQEELLNSVERSETDAWAAKESSLESDRALGKERRKREAAEEDLQNVIQTQKALLFAWEKKLLKREPSSETDA